MKPPALVSTGPPSSAGILDRGAGVLIGNGTIDERDHSGFRVAGGMWLDECRKHGIEIDYFYLAPSSSVCSAVGTGEPGTPVLARPIINAQTGREDSQVICFPGVVCGSVSVRSGGGLQGGEANGICNLCCCGCCDCCCCSYYRVDAIAGFRYLRLSEHLDIDENVTIMPGFAPFSGTQFSLLDQFSTTNNFYGGQVGVRGEVRRGKFSTQGFAKLALGDMNQVVDINGATKITLPNGTMGGGPGGILALPTNIGHHTRDEFALVPEFGVSLGYQLSCHLKAVLGYTFLYASSVARPADQIDRTVNPSQFPNFTGPGTLNGPARPAFQFNDKDFWAQGMNVGLEFRF
jgi:hypothetical protein